MRTYKSLGLCNSRSVRSATHVRTAHTLGSWCGLGSYRSTGFGLILRVSTCAIRVQPLQRQNTAMAPRLGPAQQNCAAFAAPSLPRKSVPRAGRSVESLAVRSGSGACVPAGSCALLPDNWGTSRFAVQGSWRGSGEACFATRRAPTEATSRSGDLKSGLVRAPCRTGSRPSPARARERLPA